MHVHLSYINFKLFSFCKIPLVDYLYMYGVSNFEALRYSNLAVLQVCGFRFLIRIRIEFSSKLGWRNLLQPNM
jgi:hypothetical protein